MPYSWPVTATEVDAELNLGSDTSQNAELQGFIDAATEVVENIVGPITSTAYTETLDGGNATVLLTHYPVVSVDSVTEYSSGTGQVLAAEPLGTDPYTGYSYTVDLTTGVLTRTSSGVPWRFAAGTGNVVVAYHAGRASVPASVRLAALLLTQHLWEQTQRGNSTGRPVPGAEADSDLDYGPSKESQAMALLEAYRKAPKVA